MRFSQAHSTNPPPLLSLEEDFEAVVRSTQTRIRAYIAGMGVAPHDVDDIAQDVYIELYRHFDRIPQDVAPERWLKGIARNLCMNFFRRTSRRSRLHREALAELLAQADPPHWLVPPAEAGGLDAVESDLGAALKGCYEKLPAQSQRMLLLRYQHELASADIARRLNSTAEAIRVALHRIRSKLKDCIHYKLAPETP